MLQWVNIIYPYTDSSSNKTAYKGSTYRQHTWQHSCAYSIVIISLYDGECSYLRLKQNKKKVLAKVSTKVLLTNEYFCSAPTYNLNSVHNINDENTDNT